MAEALLPLAEQEWKKPPGEIEDTPLIATLGLIGGEVLTFLEDHGATTLRELIRELGWPARMVMMAVGGLIREHLVRATQHELEVVFEPLARGVLRQEHTPEIWGG